VIGLKDFWQQLSANSWIVACRTANPTSFLRPVVGSASLLSATAIFRRSVIRESFLYRPVSSDVLSYGFVLCQAACVRGRCPFTNDVLRVHTGALMYSGVVFCWSGHGRWCQPQCLKRCTQVPAEDRSPGWPCTACNCHQYRVRQQYRFEHASRRVRVQHIHPGYAILYLLKVL